MNQVSRIILAASLALMCGGCSFLHRGGTTKTGPVPATAAVTAIKKAPPTVVRPASDFIWVGAGGKATSLKSLRGQPVVLIIGANPDEHMFRKQVSHIDHLYLDLSARKTVFLAAFSGQAGRVMSNVPFAIVSNGASVAAAYGAPAKGFEVVVISPEGNIDLISSRVEAGQRLLDIINNSYQAQASSRTGLGS